MKMGILVRSACLGSVLLLSSCSKDYRTVYERKSPDRKWCAKVSLYLPYWHSDQRLKVELQSSKEMVLLYKDDAIDVYPCFEEIYWSPDSKAVGVFVNNCYGEIHILAFDLITRKPTSSEAVRDGLRKTIAAKYKLSDKVDPLEWAHTMNARDAYSNRYNRGNANSDTAGDHCSALE